MVLAAFGSLFIRYATALSQYNQFRFLLRGKLYRIFLVLCQSFTEPSDVTSLACDFSFLC